MREWSESENLRATGLGSSSSTVGCNSSSSNSLPSGCNPPQQLPGLPLLLQAGILPPILVVGFVYLVIVTLTMGLIRPTFLELPISGSPAPAAAAGTKDIELEEK